MTRPDFANTCADSIVAWLVHHNIQHVFMVPGLQLIPLTTALIKAVDIKVVFAASELGAAYMADAYARASGNPGVCLAIATPGASNMLTAAVNAFHDNSAVLFISTDVVTGVHGNRAFQDAGCSGSNDQKLFATALENSFRLDSIDKLSTNLEQIDLCLQQSMPAHLIIPLDVQQSRVECVDDFYQTPQSQTQVFSRQILAVVEQLEQANLPVFYIGERLNNECGENLLLSIINKAGIPFVTTLSAKGVGDASAWAIGNAGYAGETSANQLLASPEVDYVVIIGVRFDERNLMPLMGSLNEKIVITIGPACCQSINMLSNMQHISVANNYLVNCLEIISNNLQGIEDNQHQQRQHTLNRLLQREKADSDIAGNTCFSVKNTLQRAREILPDTTIFTPDSGLARVFSGQSWKPGGAGKFYLSSSLATMGWSTAGTIGIALARPQTPVVALVGDGSLLMHGNEIATAVQCKLSVLWVVIVNRVYGSSSRVNDKVSAHHISGSLADINWLAWVKAMGAYAHWAEDLETVSDVIDQFLSNQQATVLLLNSDPDDPKHWPDNAFYSNE
ncbi:MAG: thiamine pyrophosphate-binding protein [Methylococcales bacterium]